MSTRISEIKLMKEYLKILEGNPTERFYHMINSGD
jgi:hypothetical protein